MSRSKLTRLTIGSPSYDPNGPPVASLLFSQFSPNNQQQFIDIGRNLGGFGLLSHPVDITRQNVRTIAPRGQFKPSVAEWQTLLPWMLNLVGAPVVVGPTETYNPGTVARLRTMEYTDATGRIHRMTGLAVSRAVISATAGQEVVLDLELQGIDWSNPGATSYPVVPLDKRLLFGDLALTLNGAAVPCRSFRLTIDHAVQNDRFYSGFVSAGPLNVDRMVMLELEIPYGLAANAWAAGAVDGGIPAVLTFTAVQGVSTSTMAVTLPAIRYPQPSPDASIPNEQMIAVQAQCFAPTVGGTISPEIVVALTP